MPRLQGALAVFAACALLTTPAMTSVASAQEVNTVRVVDSQAGDTVTRAGDIVASEVPEAQLGLIPTWLDAVDGDLYDSSNWWEGIVPGQGDSFIFGLNPSDELFTVTFPNFAWPAQNIWITNQRPIFNLAQFDGGYPVDGNLIVGSEGGGAELTILNGQLDATTVFIGNPDEQGTLTVLGGSGVFGSQLFEISPNGRLRGSGAVSSPEEVLNRGVIAPGDPGSQVGTLFINSNYRQTGSGSLRLNVGTAGGISEMDHDHLAVSGLATLGGTLIVNLNEDYVPIAGQSFTALSATFFDFFSPTFQSHYMPALPGNLVMTVQYVGGFGEGPAGSGGSVVLNVGTLSDAIGFGSESVFEGGNGLPAGMVITKIADVDGVSADDVVTLLRSTNPAFPGSAFILLNNGQASLGTPIQVTVGLDPSDLVAGDLTNDGINDIAVANAGSNDLTLLFNDGTGIFTPVNVPLEGSPRGIVAGNFRGFTSGGFPVLDLAVITTEPNALVEVRNMGNGNFMAMPPIPLDSEPVVIAAGDMNLNGQDDVVVADVNGQVMTFLSEGIVPLAGDGLTFPFSPNSTTSVSSTPRRPTGMSIEDVEGTKDPDIIVTTTSETGGIAGASPTGFLSVLLNDGMGNLTEGLTVDLDGPARSLSVWDIDDDGTTDIAVVVEDPDFGAVIRILRNDINLGDGTLVFSLEEEMFGVGDDPVYVRNGDMNNNGQRDMVSLNATGALGGLAGGEPPTSIAVWLNASGPVEPPVETCEGLCGTLGSTGACWCDAQCADFSDCCEDFCAHCDLLNPAYCGVLGGEGCGQGFWKQPHHHGHWVGYEPETQFCTVFDCSTGAAMTAYAGKSLQGVLSQGGGQLRALGRQAVAALLNATHPQISYDLLPGEVLSAVNSAIASGSNQVINTLKDELDLLNNQGCPLSGHAYLESDLNYDSAVNGVDLLILLGNWGDKGEPGTIGYKGDINHDGLIDGSDLLLMLGQWGPYSYAP